MDTTPVNVKMIYLIMIKNGIQTNVEFANFIKNKTGNSISSATIHNWLSSDGPVNMKIEKFRNISKASGIAEDNFNLSINEFSKLIDVSIEKLDNFILHKKKGSQKLINNGDLINHDNGGSKKYTFIKGASTSQNAFQRIKGYYYEYSMGTSANEAGSYIRKILFKLDAFDFEARAIRGEVIPSNDDIDSNHPGSISFFDIGFGWIAIREYNDGLTPRLYSMNRADPHIKPMYFFGISTGIAAGIPFARKSLFIRVSHNTNGYNHDYSSRVNNGDKEWSILCKLLENDRDYKNTDTEKELDSCLFAWNSANYLVNTKPVAQNISKYLLNVDKDRE